MQRQYIDVHNFFVLCSQFCTLWQVLNIKKISNILQSKRFDIEFLYLIVRCKCVPLWCSEAGGGDSCIVETLCIVL